MCVCGFGGAVHHSCIFLGVLSTETTPSRSQVGQGEVGCAALGGLVGTPVP